VTAFPSSAPGASFAREARSLLGYSYLPMTQPVVLIVDDDADFRTMMTEVLRDEGCAVVEAEDGVAALHVLDALIPDVIFMDLIMPTMNGWSLYAQLKERPELDDVQIVVLSAAPRMAPVGAPVVLRKPLDLPNLIRLVEAVRPAPSISLFRDKVSFAAERARAGGHGHKPS
jgi:CheY-like chemotaxis protein